MISFWWPGAPSTVAWASSHLASDSFHFISGGIFVARITIDDCLKRVPNRFLLANMVARRVRQIREGSEYLVSSPKNADIVMSLREVAAGRIKLILEANDGD
jgi:DNA-directed RNA polymerase subunit omega